MSLEYTLSSLGSPVTEMDAKYNLIEDMTSNTDMVQDRVLREILTQNADAEYLKRFLTGGAIDRVTFKTKVPVVTYEDLRPDIERIANGDKSPIFSSHPITEFYSSSGTSAGRAKLFPVTDEEKNRRALFSSLIMPVMNRYFPGLEKGKGLYFLFARYTTTFPCGLVVDSALTSYYKSQNFKNRLYDPYNVRTSPNETILCVDSFQSMYSQMLCGLVMRNEVLRIGTVFAYGLLCTIKFLQSNWKELAEDIKSGILNSKITDPSIRKCLRGILKPNNELSGYIVKECQGENWEKIIPRIWPNTKYIDTVVTGSMEQYIPALDFFSGGLPIVSTLYASSECDFGLNLNPLSKPGDINYTIMPNMAYFEFLLHDPTSNELSSSQKSPQELVDLVDVEVGKEYELVITNYNGLCRYRMGDILRVTGFYNSAPQFKFICRQNVLLSVAVEKTDEADLQKAIDNASALLKEFDTSIVEYTSYADTKTIPGHYVIYLQLVAKDLSNRPSNDVLNKCCHVMEESFSYVYRLCRTVDNSIGPLEVRLVKNGTFEKLMDYAISRGTSFNQYKPPRCVTDASIIKILESGVISTHVSPTTPTWTSRQHDEHGWNLQVRPR